MPQSTIAAEMAADSVASRDKLDAIVAAVKEHRAVDVEILDLEERLGEMRRRREALERVKLPEMMAEAGIDELSVPPEGNSPGLEARLVDYFRASIPNSWDKPRREWAFKTLYELGLGDVVKSTVTVTFPRDREDQAWKLAQVLRDKGFEVDLDRKVHHMTLTSAIQDLCESGRRPSVSALDSVGATVGKVVRVKRR